MFFESLLTGTTIMGGLATFFGVVLAVAYRALRVEEDPRVEAVKDMLPGSNCGACGEAGCAAFAGRVVAGEVAPRRCTVSSSSDIDAIAEFLGVDVGAEQRRVARLHCAGGKSRAAQVAAYEGYASCRAAGLVGGGGKGCAWGCLGLGDCERACGFEAIRMNAEALPVVDPALCTACGDCVAACPRDLFEVVPEDHRLFVQCAAPLSGDEAHAVCSVACDACGRCAQDAPEGLIQMRDGLPVVDYAAGGPARPDCTVRCPTGAIQWVTGEQFREQQPRARSLHVLH